MITVGMVMRVRLVGMLVDGAVFLVFLTGNVVVMEVKETFDKKHDNESGQHPPSGVVDRSQLVPGMRKQVQYAHAKHQAGDKASRHLQPDMCESNEQRNPTARQ